MKHLSLPIILGTLLLISFGCSQREVTPRKRFEIFVTALKEKNERDIQISIEPNSLPTLIKAGTRRGSTENWMEILSRDTIENQPEFSRMEWVHRDQLARVHYTSRDGSKNSILLVNSNGDWRIRLDPTTPDDELELKEYLVPGSGKGE